MHTEYHVEAKLHRAAAASVAPALSAAAPPRAPRSWFFAKLQAIIDRAGFVAVDLSHTMLVHPDRPAPAPLAAKAYCDC